MHQIEALHIGRLRVAQLDRAGIVHDDIDAPEGLGGLGDRLDDALLVADIDHQGQALAAGRLDLGGGGVDRAGELGVRLGRLGRDGDIGTVPRCPERDGEADAAPSRR